MLTLPLYLLWRIFSSACANFAIVLTLEDFQFSLCQHCHCTYFGGFSVQPVPTLPLYLLWRIFSSACANFAIVLTLEDFQFSLCQLCHCTYFGGFSVQPVPTLPLYLLWRIFSSACANFAIDVGRHENQCEGNNHPDLKYTAYCLYTGIQLS